MKRSPPCQQPPQKKPSPEFQKNNQIKIQSPLNPPYPKKKPQKPPPIQMSAAAIQLLDHLRESGVENEQAVKIAEAFDRRVEEAMRDAKSHSDRNRAEAEAHSDRNRAEAEAQAERIRAEAEEKAKSQFVTAEEYHKRDKTLATRDDLNTAIAALRADNRADNAALRAEVRAEISEIRAEFRAEMAGVRADNRATNRLILGGFVTLTAGIVAVVAKLYLGV